MKEAKKYKQLRPDNPRETLIRLFSYFKFNKFTFFGGIAFIIVGAVSQIAANAMLSPIIDTLVEDHNKRLFIKYLVIMGILVIITSVGQYIGNLLMARLAQKT